MKRPRRRPRARVGKEVLVGLFLGTVGACGRAGVPLLDQRFNLPGDLLPRLLATFPTDGSLRDVLGDACLGFGTGFLWSLMLLFVATVMRLIVGRVWPVATWALLTVLILAVESGMSQGGLVGLVEGGLRAALAVFALARCGLLACTVTISAYTILTTVQPTLDPEMWFFGARLIAPLGLAALGAWASLTAFGGRRLLPDVAES